MMITFARAAAANSLLPVFRRGVWRCVPTAHCPVPTLSLVSLSLFSHRADSSTILQTTVLFLVIL